MEKREDLRTNHF